MVSAESCVRSGTDESENAIQVADRLNARLSGRALVEGAPEGGDVVADMDATEQLSPEADVSLRGEQPLSGTEPARDSGVIPEGEQDGEDVAISALRAKVEAGEPLTKAEAEPLTMMPEGYEWDFDRELYVRPATEPAAVAEQPAPVPEPQQKRGATEPVSTPPPAAATPVRGAAEGKDVRGAGGDRVVADDKSLAAVGDEIARMYPPPESVLRGPIKWKFRVIDDDGIPGGVLGSDSGLTVGGDTVEITILRGTMPADHAGRRHKAPLEVTDAKFQQKIREVIVHELTEAQQYAAGDVGRAAADPLGRGYAHKKELMETIRERVAAVDAAFAKPQPTPQRQPPPKVPLVSPSPKPCNPAPQSSRPRVLRLCD